MTINFTHPANLWGILLLLPFLYGYAKSLVGGSLLQRRIVFGLHLVAALVVVLALAGLSVRYSSDKREILFVIDESASLSETAPREAEDYVQDVKASYPNVSTKTILFAKTPRMESDQSRPVDEDRNGTNLESALLSAISSTRPDHNARILLLSDGNETEGNALSVASTSRIPILTRPLPIRTDPEVQTADLSIPETVHQGAPFEASVLIRSNITTSGRLSLFQNGHKIETREVSLIPGENRFSFEVTADETKTIEVRAVIEAEGDSFIDNNSLSAFASGQGKPSILLIESHPDTVREFVRAMREQGIEIQVRSTEGIPKDGSELENFDAVILSDVPANEMSLQQMEIFRRYVRDAGGGFLMLGGENSFGLGGYYKTPLADLLPVRSDFEKEKENPSVAICLAIDRSGSMDGDKMIWTKDAAKGVVELLSPRDFLSVIAFDTIAHSIAPLQKVSAPSTLSQTIGTITAEGGTNIYVALDEAFQELRNVDAQFKHIVLLTDGRSEPGDGSRILRQLTDAEITLSTVGVGGDCDRFLLENLARDGNGRFYPCDDPHSIPQIFARETALAHLSSLSENPTFPVPKSIHPILDQIDLETAPPLLGYVVTEAKPSSEIHLASETDDPLLISWRYGLGIAIAFTSDVKGNWAEEWLSWPEFSRFWARLLRYAIRKETGSGITPTFFPIDGTMNVTLNAKGEDGEWIDGAEAETVVTGPDGQEEDFSMIPTAPGEYAVSFPCEMPGKYQTRLRLTKDGETLASLNRTFLVTPHHEKDIKPINESLLKEIATLTGGVFDPKPREIFGGTSIESARKTFPCWPWLFALAAILFTVEIYLRRIDHDGERLPKTK